MLQGKPPFQQKEERREFGMTGLGVCGSVDIAHPLW